MSESEATVKDLRERYALAAKNNEKRFEVGSLKFRTDQMKAVFKALDDAEVPDSTLLKDFITQFD